MSNNDFYDRKFYTITNYIFHFLLGNLYFFLMNLPMVFLIFNISKIPNSDFTFILGLSILPIGPALLALLSTMGKLVREKDIAFTKSFFKAYKNNFFEAIFYWGLGIVLLFALQYCVLLLKFNYNLRSMAFALQFIQLLVIGFVFYMLLIVSRIYINIANVFILSVQCFFKNMNITLLNIIIIAVFGLFIRFVPPAVYLLPSIACYAIMYYNRSLLDEIEMRFKEEK